MPDPNGQSVTGVTTQQQADAAHAAAGAAASKAAAPVLSVEENGALIARLAGGAQVIVGSVVNGTVQLDLGWMKMAGLGLLVRGDRDVEKRAVVLHREASA